MRGSLARVLLANVFAAEGLIHARDEDELESRSIQKWTLAGLQPN